MSFPPPTSQQARLLWLSVTALAVGVLVAMAGLMLWGLGWVLNRLSSVLLPLAVAAIAAYLLDPLVDRFERRGIPRGRAILLVFFVGLAIALGVLATVVPMLVVELGDLLQNLPQYSDRVQVTVSKWFASSHLGLKARQVWESQFGDTMQSWFGKALPAISTWLMARLSLVVSWAGLLIGLALTPVYVFYFLLEKTGISRHWTDYLPVGESRLKQEIIFVLNAINDCLIVFFRGQVLVALCDGALLTIGFLALGLDYALLLGMGAGFLSIVPYLGVAISLVPAVTLAAVQFGDWLHPLAVLALFGLVQLLEGLFISPKIMGNRVGLHPLTIIVAVMIGTTLLGGLLGGILAIPLTAALRVLMFRYVWKRPGNSETAAA